MVKKWTYFASQSAFQPRSKHSSYFLISRSNTWFKTSHMQCTEFEHDFKCETDICNAHATPKGYI